ncbi:MAG TPA: hypothetical protein VMN39_02600 [Longimicrobiaceae bacterium]|nr:hypothetical protein [Longimicrobiaceae bacterium]
MLKPDGGERGQGVAVLPDSSAAAAFLGECPKDVIAQKYIPGPEFGVFYCRYPDTDTGWIFSITEKHLVSVVGDGRRSLEELILADDRAVCMARFFLAQHRRHLLEVPQNGELVRLTQLGTHCRGALFLDGSRHRTPALETAVDRIAKAFAGFHFGRFDIRAPSVEAFREGRDLSVLELNGVTSESTDIYDPSRSIGFAWRRLMEQWTICFEIAEQNAARGFRPAPVGEIVDRIRRFRHRDLFEAPGPSDTLPETTAVR